MLVRPDTDDYRTLFLTPTPLLDTRAPVEFAHGAFPSAINLPLMSDDERAQVGTCYTQYGQQAAIDYDAVVGENRGKFVRDREMRGVSSPGQQPDIMQNRWRCTDCRHPLTGVRMSQHN